MLISDLYNLIILTIVYLLIFGLTELFYIKKNVNAEYTRKFIHVICGLISLSYVFLFKTIWPVIIISILFAILLYSTKKLKYLNSIHNVNRETYGSYLYPLTILFCFSVYLYLNNPIYYYLPFTIMIISDPLASVVGKELPIRKYKTGKELKSIGGSLFFLISAALLAFLVITYCLEFSTSRALIFSITIGVISTIAEGLSRNGIDNFIVPLSIVITLFVLNI